MRVFLSVLFAFAFLQSCGLKEREQEIRQKEQEIVRRQTELLVKEQQLTLKEKELKDKESFLDSTRMYIDTVKIYTPAITGKWSVKMRCTETTCEGSAIGDTKTEQWEIEYGSDNNVTAKAFEGSRLTRIYSGYYKTSGLYLVDDNAIRVNLAFRGKDKMEGIREITQTGCKIIYSISAEKAPQRNK